MSRIWRLAAPVAVAGSLIAAGVAPAAQASPAIYGVTISATSPHYPGAVHGKVLGFALVIYKDATKHLNTAVISGSVTGAKSGDVAALLAKPFGAKSFTATGSTLPLTAARQPYTFSVQPSVATQYEVQVTTGAIIDKTSKAETVYVTASEAIKNLHAKCSLTLKCTITYRLYVTLPSSAYKTETGKHVYLYDVFYFGRILPKFYSLVPSATASKAHKVNAGQFYNLITFHIKFRSPTQNWLPASCGKDTESRDGLGLPGHHGCGAKKVSTKAVYLG